ncbi:hypothetical protein Hamer_G009570, partial [Homarus americanus]
HHGAITPPSLHYTDNKRIDHPIELQASLTEDECSHKSHHRDSIIVYPDGSLQNTGTAGCAYATHSGMKCVAFHIGRAQGGIMGVINYLLDEEWSGLVISDSRSGLESITSPRPACQGLPSQTRLCRQPRNLPIPDDASTITTGRVKTLLKKVNSEVLVFSTSDKHCGTKYQYSRNK